MSTRFYFDPDDAFEVFEDEPLLALCFGVIARTILDLGAANPQLQRDAREFFESPRFEWILDVLGVSPIAFRNRLASSEVLVNVGIFDEI